MATTTIPQSLSPRTRRTVRTGVTAVTTGLAITLAVTAALLIGPGSPTHTVAPVLGPMDDWYFRNRPAPAQVERTDDYCFRHLEICAGAGAGN